MYYCYRHIRTDKNEPFYIGISESKPRYKSNSEVDIYKRAFSKQRSKFWKSVAKNGYRVEIFFESENKNDVIEKEIEFIQIYGLRSDGGTLVNMTYGGEHTVLSEESKKAISKRMMGNKNSLGKKLSEEQKIKLSEANKGRVPWSYGKKMSKEFCEKISKSKKGMTISEKHRLNLLNSKPNCKSIVCLNTGFNYKSISDCVRIMFNMNNVKSNSTEFTSIKNGIIRNLKGRTKSYKGYKFVYA